MSHNHVEDEKNEFKIICPKCKAIMPFDDVFSCGCEYDAEANFFLECTECKYAIENL